LLPGLIPVVFDLFGVESLVHEREISAAYGKADNYKARRRLRRQGSELRTFFLISLHLFTNCPFQPIFS
jgi:hypothetical protein